MDPDSPLPPDFDINDYETIPPGTIDWSTGEVIEVKPEPEWDDASVASALDHAVTIIEAFNRPDLDYDTWWQGFAPLMDYDAQITYANVDPANAPALKVTGDATLEDPKSAYVANVTVPTSVGTWGVLMLRADAESPWLGERIEFPEGIH